ncbi:hypothetical protein ABI59_03755 [Acidobacteria bacterium Mor1]|nr:hypothetical protein ABI59_03755 [Acidobacteria bacterium Mor1]
MDALEERLGYRFQDRALLIRALTHGSYRATADEADENYERLEFLGDTLLGFVVAEWLMKEDPRAAEGVLTRRRQTVVRTPTLARAARRLGIGELLRLGPGELRSGGRSKPSLLADAFEAVLGAIYFDGGLRKARSFAYRALRGELQATRGEQFVREDNKTRLQELVQARVKRTPVYRLVGERGPAHRPEFEAAVYVGKRRLASGIGSSRKEAEQQAALQALGRLKQEGAEL